MNIPDFRGKVSTADVTFKGDVSKEDLGLMNGGKKFKTIQSAMNFIDVHFDEKKLREEARKRELPVTVLSAAERQRFLLSLLIYLPNEQLRTFYRMMVTGANRRVMAMTMRITFQQVTELEEKCVEIIDNVLATKKLGNPAAGALQ